MLETLLIVSLLIWIPVLLFQMNQRGFLVLLIWLFVAPVATNLVQGHTNPFFVSPAVHEARVARTAPGGSAYATHAETVRLDELLEPTRILLGAFVIVFLVGAVLKKTRTVPLDKTESWMAVFCLIAVVSVLLLSGRLAFGLRTTIDAFIIPFLGYSVARRLVTDEDRFRILTRVLGYMGVYVIVLCFMERMMHGAITYRLSGPFQGTGELYMVLVTAFFAVLIGGQFLSCGVRWSVLYLTPVVILLTWSRANWVGFLAAGWVFMFLARRLTEKSRKLQTMGLALMLIPIAAVAIQGALMEERIEARVTQYRTPAWRFERWRIAMQEGIENPIFGIGLNNTRDVFGARTRHYAGSHNTFVSFFAELGAIGLLAYLAIVASLIRMGFRLYRTGPHARDRWRGVAVVAVMAGYQIGGLFYNYHYSTALSQVYVYVFLGGIAGLYSRHGAVVNDDLKRAMPTTPTPSSQWGR